MYIKILIINMIFSVLIASVFSIKSTKIEINVAIQLLLNRSLIDEESKKVQGGELSNKYKMNKSIRVYEYL